MGPGGSARSEVVRAGSRWKRGTLAVAAALAAALLSYIPFVWPTTDVPRRADAIIVLSGDHGERRAVAFRLLDEGVAGTLVFVGTPDLGDEDDLCRNGWRSKEVICLRPQPDGTRQEAQAVGELADHRGWKKVVVATTTYHVARAKLLFDRCVDGDVSVVPARRSAALGDTARQTVREWMVTGYFAVFKRGC